MSENENRLPDPYADMTYAEYLAATADDDGYDCEHPGVFATGRPAELCPRCGRDVPRAEL